MSDEELAAGLHIDVALVPRIALAKRELYERLLQAADELVLWQHGVGPMPRGVIVCREHKKPKRKERTSAHE